MSEDKVSEIGTLSFYIENRLLQNSAAAYFYYLSFLNGTNHEFTAKFTNPAFDAESTPSIGLQFCSAAFRSA